MARWLLLLLALALPALAQEWQPFNAPEFEASFPGSFDVKAGKDSFEVRCQHEGQTFIAGFATLAGSARPDELKARLEKAGFQVTASQPGKVGGKPGLVLKLKAGPQVAEARVCQQQNKLYEAIWIGGSGAAPDKFWSSFQVH